MRALPVSSCIHIVEDRQVKPAWVRGIGDQLDCDDLPTRDREAQDEARPSAGTQSRFRRSTMSAGQAVASAKDADGNVIGLVQSP
jgi:hypothetical protein